MLWQTPPVQEICALTAGLSLKTGGGFPHTHPHECNRQKCSVYLPDLGFYAEPICVFTRFGVIGGNFLSKNEVMQPES